jgi:hypothetical protein
VIILDTDHFMILQVGKGSAYDGLSARMDASPDQDFATTVITFEEHMRGWLAGIRRARAIYSRIVQTRRVPQDARLYAMNGWVLKDGTHYTVWWVNIDVVTGKNAGFGLRIKENNAPVAKPKGEPKLELPDKSWLPKPSA